MDAIGGFLFVAMWLAVLYSLISRFSLSSIEGHTSFNESFYDEEADLAIFRDLPRHTISGINATDVMSEEEFLNYIREEHSAFGRINRHLNQTYSDNELVYQKQAFFHEIGGYQTLYVNRGLEAPKEYFTNILSSYDLL